MKILLSPAKRLDEKKYTNSNDFEFTNPVLLNKSKDLIKYLKRLKPDDISNLMSLSKNLGQLNYSRYQSWETPFDKNISKAAIFMFMGDAYRGLDVKTFTKNEVLLLNNKLRILSGLYGLLKPLDLILPYRLEMKTKLITSKTKNLYEYWRDVITNQLNNEIKADNNKYIINLASNEYFKVLNYKKINAKIISPVFKEEKNGKYKIIAINAKRARGLMTRYIIKNNIKKINDLKGFDYENYYFSEKMSNINNIVFIK